MLLSINKKVWSKVALDNGYQLENAILPNAIKIINDYKDANITCDLGGGFFGSYSTITTRLTIKNNKIDEQSFEKRIKQNNSIIDELNKFKSSKIYLVDGNIVITSNGIINKEDKLKMYLDLAVLVVDCLS